MTVKRAPKTHLHTHHHAVQFYGNDESLIATVGGFLSEGLVTGHPAIIIATRSHNEAIARELASRLIDVDAAATARELHFLDADAMLATFMVGDIPNPGKFRHHVGGLIKQALGDRPTTIVRAYGEMVDVLWKQGREDAAIRLEILWNQLAQSHGFALLCGYSMGNFYKQAERFQEVCQQHTHVMHTDENVIIFRKDKHAKTA